MIHLHRSQGYDTHCCISVEFINYYSPLRYRTDENIVFEESIIEIRRDDSGRWHLALVPIALLKPHEEIDELHLHELRKRIISDGMIMYPVIVDIKTLTILNGHHRVEILKRMGKKYVPAILVDYDNECVKVFSWRKEWSVTKELVRKAALSGHKLPPRTSRHVLCFEIPRVDLPLDRL